MFTPSPSASREWLARLELGFESRRGRTVLASRRHRGPLVVQKPFYPEGDDCCHVYLVHPPAGVVGGDRLETALKLSPGARALVTTPGATKFYRSAGQRAALVQEFSLASGAVLEWLPQESIVHDGARAGLETEARLQAGALFAGWEIACLGLPASDRPFASGEFLQGLHLERDGEPLFLDRCLFEGGSRALSEPWGLGGSTVAGLFTAILPSDAELSEPGVSDRTCLGRMGDILVARYLGDDAWQAKRDFTTVWRAWRLAALGKPACPPRIWTT